MRRGGRLASILVSILTLALLAGVSPYLAAQEHGEEKKGQNQKEEHGKEQKADHDTTGKGGHKEEKPFNPLEVAADLAIWTTVVFLILFFILKRFAWGPILEGLRKREETIRAAVEEAQRARIEAEKARAEFQQEMARAQQQIPAIMEEAHKKADKLVEELRTKATEEIAADRQRLRREIETAKDQALADIWGQAAQLATLISAKAIRRELSPDDHRRLVDEALDEMRQQADNQRR
jgi:F-type H+-transporting ATPase subunit b